MPPDATSSIDMPDGIARDGKPAAVSGRRRVMSLGAFAVVVGFVACLHLGFWALKKPDTAAASVDDRLPSVSYNRFAQKTSDGLIVPEAQIRTDLTAIAGYAKSVRTYASTQGCNGFRRSPPNSGSRSRSASGSTRTRHATNARSRPRSIWRGAILTSPAWWSATKPSCAMSTPRPNLANIVRRVKRDSPVPVASADHWKTFIDHPELVDAVDEVFAHILPYWEGMPKANRAARARSRFTISCAPNIRTRKS